MNSQHRACLCKVKLAKPSMVGLCGVFTLHVVSHADGASACRVPSMGHAMCPSPPWSSGTPNSDTNLPQGMGHAMRSSPPWSPSAPNSDTPPCSLSDRRSAQNTHIATPTPPHVRCPICVRAARTHARRSPKNALRLEVHDGSTHPVSHATPHPCSLLAMQPLPCSLLAVPLDPPVTFSTSHAAAAMQPAML